MRKIFLILGIILLTCTGSFAAKIPDDVRNYIQNAAPNTDIRFDGVIILPDNTIYLPLFPSLFCRHREGSVRWQEKDFRYRQ